MNRKPTESKLDLLGIKHKTSYWDRSLGIRLLHVLLFRKKIFHSPVAMPLATGVRFFVPPD